MSDVSSSKKAFPIVHFLLIWALFDLRDVTDTSALDFIDLIILGSIGLVYHINNFLFKINLNNEMKWLVNKI